MPTAIKEFIEFKWQVRARGEKYNTRQSVGAAEGVLQTNSGEEEGSLPAGVIRGGLLDKMEMRPTLKEREKDFTRQNL